MSDDPPIRVGAMESELGAAEDQARRSSMTLGDWLNRTVGPAPSAEPEARKTPEPEPKIPSVADSIDRLIQATEAAQEPEPAAAAPQAQAAAPTPAPIPIVQAPPEGDTEHLETMVDQLAREQTRMAERLARLESEAAGTKSAETLRALETAVGQIAARLAEAPEPAEPPEPAAVADPRLEALALQVAAVAERLARTEQRVAGAIDAVGEQAARAAERLERQQAEVIEALNERIARAEAAAAAVPPQAAPDVPPQAPAVLEPATPAPAEAFSASMFPHADIEPLPAMFKAVLDTAEREAAVGFAPIAEEPSDPQERAEHMGEAADVAQPLSTREVIERARAAARAARPEGEQDARPKPAKSGGLFGGGQRKSAASASTLHTAVLVAGSATFLALGAAGVVLMDRSGGLAPQEFAQVFGTAQPRASVAIAPTPAPAADAELEAPDSEAIFTAAIRAIRAGDAEALDKLRSLAEAGYAPAQFYLAKLYESGGGGAAQNMAEARRWAGLAAEGGDARAMHNLALFQFRGDGGPQDLEAAARWFRRAAARGVVDSQFNLAVMHQYGSGVPVDLVEAYRWYAIAARGGDDVARANAAGLEARLSPAALSAANAAVAAFRPEPPNLESAAAGLSDDMAPGGTLDPTRGTRLSAAQ
jgi:localization factor PodJL